MKKQIVSLIITAVLIAACTLPVFASDTVTSVSAVIGQGISDTVPDRESSETNTVYDGIIAEIQSMLGETKNMTDEQLHNKLNETAGKYGVTLNDTQLTELTDLCRSLEGLSDIDLAAVAENARKTLETVSDTAQKLSGFAAKLSQLIKSVIEFFNRIAESASK